MDTLIISVITFIAGVIVGFFGRGIFNKSDSSENRANTFVLVVVTLIWATSVLIDIASPTYETSPFIHGLMGAIVGFFFKPWQSSSGDKTSRNANNNTQVSQIEKEEERLVTRQQYRKDTAESGRRDEYDEAISNAEEDITEARRRKAYDEVKEKGRKK